VKKMARLEKPTARIPGLRRDNWSTWKEKFKALLVYKSLYVAIESLDFVEGRKASDQARSLIFMHTEDAYEKLFAGADTAEVSECAQYSAAHPAMLIAYAQHLCSIQHHMS
jgi:hypothetical protein